jgi:hypothetical protein
VSPPHTTMDSGDGLHLLRHVMESSGVCRRPFQPRVHPQLALRMPPVAELHRHTAVQLGLHRRARSFKQKWNQTRRRPLSRRENGLFEWVELRGLEPLTPTLPGRHDPLRRGSSRFRNGFELGIRTGGNAGVQPRTSPTATRTATKAAAPAPLNRGQTRDLSGVPEGGFRDSSAEGVTC